MRMFGRAGIAVAVMIIFLGAGLAAVHPNLASASSSPRVALAPGAVPLVASPHPTLERVHAALPSSSNLTFPRTVLIETFTGVWCIHCPSESQALYAMDQVASHSSLIIAELHSCASSAPGQCYENYAPPDRTDILRGMFYNVCGYPDVFTDGGPHANPPGICGATNSESQMYGEYQRAIANASKYAGNVSISGNAQLSGSNVVGTMNVTSGLTGSYSTISYLMEYIGKVNQTNGYGPHSIGWVVRETLLNHPQSYTAGSTLTLHLRGALLSTWNTLNLSVVTFVEDNSTKAVENSFFAPVTTLATTVSVDQATINSKGTAKITVQVTNSSTGMPVAGANVTLTTSGGALNPASGSTSGTGAFTSTFTAPTVSATQTFNIAVQVNALNYTAGGGATAITVNPLYPPTVPTGFAITAGVEQVSLNWTAPSTGGTGVNYLVSEASAASGPWTTISQTTQTQYLATGLVIGQVLWFRVGAQGPGGFSPNTTSITVASADIGPAGISATTGWWFQVGAWNFSSSTSGTLNLFLPGGGYIFSFGANSYAYLPVPPQSYRLVVASTPITLSLQFSLRQATLIGTVNPSTATVTFNGTPLGVSGGEFQMVTNPGTYWLNATENGYTSNSTQVHLTPGNVSRVNFLMEQLPSSTTSSSSPFGGDMVGIIAIAVIAAGAVILVAVVATSKGRGGRGGARRSGAREPSDEPPADDES